MKQPRTILVWNAGSSSLKAAVLKAERVIGRWSVTGFPQRPILSSGQHVRRLPVGTTVIEAATAIAQEIEREKIQPTLQAHRIVHGGGRWTKPVRLTPTVVRQLKKLAPLAPLHMPVHLAIIAWSQRRWAETAQWGVFDTAAFHSMPETAWRYALPVTIADRWGIRKYGFHGVAHLAALESAAKRMSRPLGSLNAVTIHLGSGDSMARWVSGRAVDTTMGFTPVEGLTMATRSGDLDPMIPLFLQRQGMSLAAVETLLQKESGLFGLTGYTDIRDVMSAAGYPVAGWPRRKITTTQRRRAEVALDIFVYDIARYLASYIGLSTRTDVIVFSGAVGQNSVIRKMILAAVPAARQVKVVTVATDEESVIAAQVLRMVR